MDLSTQQRQKLSDWLRRKQGWLDRERPLFADILTDAEAALGFAVDRAELIFAAKLSCTRLPEASSRPSPGRGTLTQRVTALEEAIAELRREAKARAG